MIIINDNYYSNDNKSDDNKTKIIECVTKIIKVLLTCVVIIIIIIIIIEIIKY